MKKNLPASVTRRSTEINNFSTAQPVTVPLRGRLSAAGKFVGPSAAGTFVGPQKDPAKDRVLVSVGNKELAVSPTFLDRPRY